MPLTAEELQKLATLARVEIRDDELDAYRESVSGILEFVEQLAAVDTTGIEPMAHPLADMRQRLRPDEVSEKNQRDLFQKSAPAVAEGLYLVPAVIE